MTVIKKVENKLGMANGTFYFLISSIIVKVIGAVYKVPLFNLLGANGIGLYQMVFPVYALLLTLSGGGISSGITRLIAKHGNEKLIVKKCMAIYLPIGLFFSALLFFGSDFISLAQGNFQASALYKAISPSVFLVCILGVLRGYFQGKNRFLPTATSQIVEQVVKCVSGLIALLFAKGDYVVKAFWACFAITFSEVIAAIYMCLLFKLKKDKLNQENKGSEKEKSKKITYAYLISFIMPLTLSSVCIPLSSFITSFIAVNSLKYTFGVSATEIYGIYMGGVDALILFPVTLLNCISLGFLPKLSLDKKGARSVLIVGVLSLLCAIAIAICAPVAVKILFGKNTTYYSLAVSLVRASSVCIVLHSLLHAVSSLTLSCGKQKYSFIFLFIGVVVKTFLDLTLIKMPKVNIFGMVISDAGCFFVALSLNLVYIYYIIIKAKQAGSKNELNVSRIRGRRKLSFRKSV